MASHRVCVIGAGPSGMSAIYQHHNLDLDGRAEVVCYEKQADWGGLWNFTWHTGTDEFGEVCHNGMYRHLWNNAPKETFELPDYTFKEHFGKPTPSFLPREAVKKYLEGRWIRDGPETLRKMIKFNHVVRFVKYNEKYDDFTVMIFDLKNQSMAEEKFSHVIVASGIFSTPNKPSYPGIEDFEGRVLHSHDFREAIEFKNQRLLVIGGKYSAEDVAMMCIKYGAKSAIISYRTGKPLNRKWPKGIQERTGVKQILPTSVIFDDDSTADIDVIILGTGYIYSFPFLDASLQLKSNVKTSLYPGNLYKGIVWTDGGNKKLFYIGVLDQVWAAPMFDLQAAFVWKYIIKELPGEPRSEVVMKKDIQKWMLKNSKITCLDEAIDYQKEYLTELITITGRKENLASDVYHGWWQDKQENMATFRDQCYASVHSGQPAIKNKPWMENFDEGIDNISTYN